MKIKTSDLIGKPLNWGVGKAGAEDVVMYDGEPGLYDYEGVFIVYEPSINWAQGGPIIDQEEIATRKHSNGKWFAMKSKDLGDSECAQWNKTKPGERYGPMSYEVTRVQCRFEGPTALIAAMRCFVASRLGDEVDIPEELS